MRVIKHCCASCDSVIVQTTQSDVVSSDMIDCQSCKGHLSCYLIEDPFDIEDYQDEIQLILEDLSGFENNTIPDITTDLAAENKDLRASIVELKEWSEEYIGRTNMFLLQAGMDKRGIIYQQEIAKRGTAMKQVVEHCEAALEGKIAE